MRPPPIGISGRRLDACGAGVGAARSWWSSRSWSCRRSRVARSSNRCWSWRWSRVARSGSDVRVDVFIRSGDDADRRRYWHFLADQHQNFAQNPVGLRLDFHRHLVGGYFQQGLALLYFLAFFYQPSAYCAAFHGQPQFGHDDLSSHISLSLKECKTQPCKIIGEKSWSMQRASVAGFRSTK